MDGKGPSFHCQHTNSHSNGKNGWQWFLSELTEQGIISQAEIHALAVSSAKSEFAISDKHRSKWTIDELQSNYIYINSQNSVYSVSDRVIMGTDSISVQHQFVWESKEAKQAGDKPKKGMAAMMLSNNKHTGCKIVTSERFDPSTTKLISHQNDISYLNSWQGFHLTPVPGNVKAFHKHISVICPDSAEAEAFTDFLAHVIQRPWERPTWSPVHVSVPQGLGRGILNSLMEYILHPYFANPTPKDLFDSNYNEYMKNTIWIGVEETSVHAAKGVSAKIKELITATHMNINPKYGKQVPNYPMYARFFFMTNELDALPIEDSDRRFWVIGPSEPGYRPLGSKYYDKFALAIHNKQFQAAVLHDLLHRDISKFSAHHIPFRTALKSEMQMATRTPVEKALNRITECRYFPPFMETKRIKSLIIEYIDHNRMHASDNEITQVMKKLPMYSDNKMMKIKGKVCRFRIMYNPNKYKRYSNNQVRDVLAKEKEIPLDWMKE